MCMKFNFISICTYLCGGSPMYCSFTNYFGPNLFGDRSVLIWVLGTLGYILGACILNKEEVASTCQLDASKDNQRIISSSYYQLYLGNKYLSLMHTYLVPNLV